MFRAKLAWHSELHFYDITQLQQIRLVEVQNL